MERPDSDWDYTSVYTMPYRDVLLRKQSMNRDVQRWMVDAVFVEIGDFVIQLKKGNFLTHVTLFSEKIWMPERSWKWLYSLRADASENISKEMSKSLFGAVKSTMSMKNDPDKRLKMAARLLRCASVLFGKGRWEFLPVVANVTVEDVNEYQDEVKSILERSSLPDKPTRPEMYDEFVVSSREYFREFPR